MSIFAVFFSVVMPIFLMIGLGTLLDRLFRLDIGTLSKINFYAFVPALIFLKILDADLTASMMLDIGIFSLLHMMLLFVVSWLLLSGPRWKKSRVVLSQSVIFFNSGNYGIPLVLLGFGNGGIGILAVVLLIQNLMSFSFGIWLFERNDRPMRSILLGLLKIPTILAIVTALLMRYWGIGLLEELRKPLTFLADGIIPLALLALGAQIARTRMAQDMGRVMLASVLRLLVSPALAFLLMPFFGFSGMTASVLVVTAGLPVAVNVYMMAAEYRHDEALASQVIFWSTLFSAVTMTLLLRIFQ